LVDVLTAHNLKRLDCRGIGSNCPELTEGPHCGLHACLRPVFTVHVLDFIWGNKPA
jgi:hypothetical protein